MTAPLQRVTPAVLGRDAEVDQLARLLAGERPVWVVGEAGIGKTTLVRAAAQQAGRAIREGGAFATLSWMPFLAVRRALDRPVAGDPAEVARLVEAEIGPDLLFIDDLQWADRDTAAVVGRVAGIVGLVVAVRAGDPGAAESLQLGATIGAEIVRVSGLDRETAAQLARQAAPRLTDREVRDIVDRAGGNPLLVEELALRGGGAGSLARAIARQLDELTTDDRLGAELLAVAGRPLAAARLGGAASRLTALRLADLAEDGSLALRHALLAEAIVRALPADAIAARHRQLATIVTDPLEQSRHLHQGGRLEAAARLAFDATTTEPDPARRAALLELAALTSEPAVAARRRIEAAVALRAVGDNQGTIRVLEGPIQAPDNVLAERSAELAMARLNTGAIEAAWAELKAAKALRPDPASRGAIELARMEASLIVNTGGSYEEAITVLERARIAASGKPSSYRLRGSLATLRLFSKMTTDTSDLERAWRDSMDAADGGTAANLAVNLHYALLMHGGGRPALAFILEAASRLESIGYGARADELRAEACQVSIFAGDLVGTVVLADTALEHPLGLRPRQRALYMRALALVLLGRFDDAEATIAEVEGLATDDFDGIGSVLWVRAELAWWSGRPDRAIDLAGEAVSKPALSLHEYVLPSLTRAWAQIDLGQAPAPLPGTTLSRVLSGAEPEHRGIVAMAAGDHTGAQAAFDEAAATWAGYYVIREPLARWAAGEAARRAGRIDDALERFETALAQAATLGLAPLAARILRSLRLAGRRPRGPAPRRRETRPGRRDARLLTPREREVVGLVGRGLTNTEISRRMGLGRPTVARMLSNAMLKLGASSRAQAVVLAAGSD